MVTLNKSPSKYNRKVPPWASTKFLAIDNPKKTALLSSYTTTPFVRKILLDIISILNIEKQTNQKEKDYEWYDKKYYEVPNVIGLNKKEAKYIWKKWILFYISNIY